MCFRMLAAFIILDLPFSVETKAACTIILAYDTSIEIRRAFLINLHHPLLVKHLTSNVFLCQYRKIFIMSVHLIGFKIFAHNADFHVHFSWYS